MPTATHAPACRAPGSRRRERRELLAAAIGVQDRIGQPLEQLRFVGADTEVMQLHLRLRPGERQGTLKHSRVTVLVSEMHHLVARGADNS